MKRRNSSHRRGPGRALKDALISSKIPINRELREHPEQIIEELVDATINHAKDTLREFGEVAPAVVMDSDWEIIVYLPDSSTNRFGVSPTDIARLVAGAYGATIAVLLLEKSMPEQAISSSPFPQNQTSLRKCVVIQVEGPNQRSVRVLPIKWDANGKFADLETVDDPKIGVLWQKSLILPQKTMSDKERLETRYLLERMGVGPSDLGLNPKHN